MTSSREQPVELGFELSRVKNGMAIHACYPRVFRKPRDAHLLADPHTSNTVGLSHL